MKQTPSSTPTQRQSTVLRTLDTHNRMTAREIGVRVDVLWRMEALGWVTRNMHDQWSITGAGRQASERRPV